MNTIMYKIGARNFRSSGSEQSLSDLAKSHISSGCYVIDTCYGIA